jgi:hypothetical protein
MELAERAETPATVLALAARDLVRIWELGEARDAAERALCMLAVALPGVTWDELATLPLGSRDGRLLRVREALFGSALAGYAECPSCGERLEYTLDAAAIAASAPETEPAMRQTYTVESGPYSLVFRLPATRDLVEVAASADAAEGRQVLTRRCVLAASRHGDTIDAASLPDDALERLAQEMSARDPQAEIWLDLTCPACGQGWPLLFDIASFLWQEISVEARRLLREVHALARAYGWREADILALSAARRQFYLDLVAEG